MKVFTIGVYHSTEESFFRKLAANAIDTLIDIRQRRGLRGREYAFANSKYLQKKISEMGIRYLYVKELAPTTEIRLRQKADDLRLGERKRDRNMLGDAFKEGYRTLILPRFDFDALVSQLQAMGACRIALLCVEEKASACHRSLVAEELRQRYGFETINL